MDTIFAVSSGRPPAAIAVVRISGPAAFDTARLLAGTLPSPRRASLRTLRDAAGGVLDRALMLVFPGPATATGDDLVELHCHGGRAVVEAIERTLASMGLRPAVAGEFTRRALSNGRIDLAEAQGLADLLTAETERQRLAALSATEGRISRAIRGWLKRLAVIAARVEATLDFSDEDDVGPDDIDGIRQAMASLAGEMAIAASAPTIDRLRDGIRVVLAGPPNSGKSTLLNLLSERDAAIVSPIAGTTRDRIEAPVRRDGIPYVLIDTAGLIETADVIEQIGVSRANEAIETADVLLWLADEAPSRTAIWVHARADELGRRTAPSGAVATARNSANSIDCLWQAIAAAAEALLPRPDDLALSRTQVTAIADALRALATTSLDPLIIAESLRIASRQIATILGIDATEAMLDQLFGSFCIGK